MFAAGDAGDAPVGGTLPGFDGGQQPGWRPLAQTLEYLLNQVTKLGRTRFRRRGNEFLDQVQRAVLLVILGATGPCPSFSNRINHSAQVILERVGRFYVPLVGGAPFAGNAGATLENSANGVLKEVLVPLGLQTEMRQPALAEIRQVSYLGVRQRFEELIASNMD